MNEAAIASFEEEARRELEAKFQKKKSAVLGRGLSQAMEAARSEARANIESRRQAVAAATGERDEIAIRLRELELQFANCQDAIALLNVNSEIGPEIEVESVTRLEADDDFDQTLKDLQRRRDAEKQKRDDIRKEVNSLTSQRADLMVRAEALPGLVEDINLTARRRLKNLRETAKLFVDHAFTLSRAISLTHTHCQDLKATRKSSKVADRDRFWQTVSGSMMLEQMPRLVCDLQETRGKWRHDKET
jgi:hypothetical protein